MKNLDGQMVPIGAIAELREALGPPLISLYNLYPSAAIVGSPATGFSSGEGISADGPDRQHDPAAGVGL